MLKRYVPNPTQCYNCQRIGHTTKSCTAKNPRCMLCGEGHKKEMCTKTQSSCANCKCSHSANSKYCPLLRTARQIEKVRVSDNVDYSTARKTVVDLHLASRDHSPHLTMPRYSQPATSYATATKGSSIIRKPSTESAPPRVEKLLKDSSTQTDNNDLDVSTTGLHDHSKFLYNLRNLLLDVININLKIEKNTRLNLTDKAILKNFGVNLEPLRHIHDDATEAQHLEIKAGTKRKLADKQSDAASSSEVDESAVLSEDYSTAGDSSMNRITVEKTETKKKKKKIPKTVASTRTAGCQGKPIFKGPDINIM